MAKKADEILSLEELEKSWNDSKSILKSLLNDDEAALEKEDLSKATKDEDEETEEEESTESDEDEETEEEEAVEETAKKKMKKSEDEKDEKDELNKSLESEMEADEDTANAMDVEPFLRKLTKSISKKFENLEKENKILTNVLAKSLIALGEQNMTIAANMQAIAEAPVGSRSVIRKSMERFGGKKEGEDNKNDLLKSLSYDQILTKSLKLVKDGVFTSLDMAKIQNRLNKNMPLADEHVDALVAKEAK